MINSQKLAFVNNWSQIILFSPTGDVAPSTLFASTPADATTFLVSYVGERMWRPMYTKPQPGIQRKPYQPFAQ